MGWEWVCYCPICPQSFSGEQEIHSTLFGQLPVLCPDARGHGRPVLSAASLGCCHEQTLLPAPLPPSCWNSVCTGVHQGASMEQARSWYPERNFNTTGEASVLGYSSTTRHTDSSTHQEPAPHMDMAVLTSTRSGASKERQGPESVGATIGSFLWVSRTQGYLWKPVPCAGSKELTWPSKGRAGLAERVQHFQGFLPSIVPRSVQPKSICSEGVESHQHKQEALSKKALSVLLRRCNHVRNTKRHRHLQKSRRWL